MAAAFVFAVIVPKREIIFIIPQKLFHLISMGVGYAALLLHQLYDVLWRYCIGIVVVL